MSTRGRRIARGSRGARGARNAHVGELSDLNPFDQSKKTHPTLDKVRKLDLPGKAADTAAAATRWAQKRHSASETRKGLGYGLRIARGLRDAVQKWSTTLDNLGPLVGMYKPDYAAKLQALKDASSEMDARILAAANWEKELAGRAAVPGIKPATKPELAGPGALRDLMVSVHPTVAAFVASLSLIEGLGSLVPMPSLDPILRAGQEFARVLVQFANWLRNVATGIGIALLLLVGLMLHNKTRR